MTKINHKTTSFYNKQTNKLNRQLSKEVVQIGPKNVRKTIQHPQPFLKCQLNYLRFHVTPVRVIKAETQRTKSCCKRKRDPHCCWKYKLVVYMPLWWSIWLLLKNLKNRTTQLYHSRMRAWRTLSQHTTYILCTLKFFCCVLYTS